MNNQTYFQIVKALKEQFTQKCNYGHLLTLESFKTHSLLLTLFHENAKADILKNVLFAFVHAITLKGDWSF